MCQVYMQSYRIVYPTPVRVFHRGVKPNQQFWFVLSYPSYYTLKSYTHAGCLVCCRIDSLLRMCGDDHQVGFYWAIEHSRQQNNLNWMFLFYCWRRPSWLKCPVQIVLLSATFYYSIGAHFVIMSSAHTFINIIFCNLQCINLYL